MNRNPNDSQPLKMLKEDHDFVRDLFDRYLTTEDIQVKQELGPRILSLLEIHTALEETTFYPAAARIDPSLVEECQMEHEEADQLILQIKNLDAVDPQCDDLFQQLADAVLEHIENEEGQLFPKIAESDIDLEALGLEMQIFENNMVSRQARQSESASPFSY